MFTYDERIKGAADVEATAMRLGLGVEGGHGCRCEGAADAATTP